MAKDATATATGGAMATSASKPIGWAARRRCAKAFKAAYEADDLDAAMAAFEEGRLAERLGSANFPYDVVSGGDRRLRRANIIENAIERRRWRWIAPLLSRLPLLADSTFTHSNLSLALRSIAEHSGPKPRPEEADAARALLAHSLSMPSNGAPNGFPFDKCGMQRAACSAMDNKWLPPPGLAALHGNAPLMRAFAEHAAAHILLEPDAPSSAKELLLQAGPVDGAQRAMLRSSLRTHCCLPILMEAAEVARELLKASGSKGYQECLDALAPLLGKLAPPEGLPWLASAPASPPAEPSAERPASPSPMEQSAFQEVLLREIAKLSAQVQGLRGEVEQLRSERGAAPSGGSKIASWRWGRKDSPSEAASSAPPRR